MATAVELILSFKNFLQICILLACIVFFLFRSAAMQLKKAFIWLQNPKFSLESKKPRFRLSS